MDRIYRNGTVAGAIMLAICIGLILGGNHSPPLIGGAICAALYTGGQVWARRRN